MGGMVKGVVLVGEVNERVVPLGGIEEGVVLVGGMKEGVVLVGGMKEGVVLVGGMEGVVPLRWRLGRICCTSFSQSFSDYRVAASFPSLQ